MYYEARARKGVLGSAKVVKETALGTLRYPDRRRREWCPGALARGERHDRKGRTGRSSENYWNDGATPGCAERVRIDGGLKSWSCRKRVRRGCAGPTEVEGGPDMVSRKRKKRSKRRKKKTTGVSGQAAAGGTMV